MDSRHILKEKYRTCLWIRYKVSGREEGQVTVREGFKGARFLTEQLHAK